jgi:ubiquinone/menaquinone biosynthesis C-methylase UbiE
MNKNKDWQGAGLSFNQVADDYDAYRPDYPEKLVETILDKSSIPDGGKILEIGSGTGKATLPFARRGYEILCIDPGENLVNIAQKKMQNWPAVRWETIPFQDWQEIPHEFDLVISAQAFHWVPQPAGYLKVANALKNAGTMALIWNMQGENEGRVFKQLEQVYQELAPELDDGLTSEEVIHQREQEIRNSVYFKDVEVIRFPWSMRFTTHQYLGVLGTHSDHLHLEDKQRSFLFEGIAEVIDKNGGVIEKPFQAVLYLARVRQ